MNEWSFFCANGGEGSGSEVFFVQMLGTNPDKCEWVWEGKTKMADSKIAKFMMEEFKMAAIIKLSENEWVWVRLN